MSSYATQANIEERYGSDALLVAADRDGDGVLDVGVVTRALEDATEEINGYVGSKYPLPLATTPKLLVRLCVDIAFYRLSADAGSGTEEKRKRYEDVVKVLKSIASGEVRIADINPPPATTNGGASVAGPARRFTRDSQRRFR